MKTVSNLLSCSLHTVRPPRIFLFKINLLIHSGLVNELNWELGQFEGFFLFLKKKLWQVYHKKFKIMESLTKKTFVVK